MKNIFTLDNFPFLLTVLFGLIGYQLNKVTDTIINSPVIEYNLYEDSSYIKGDSTYKKHICEITNITSNTSFKDLTINFQCNEKNSLRMYSPQISTIPPSSRYYDDPVTLDGVLLEYTISTLQPEDRYKLLFRSTTLNTDKLSKPSLFLKADGTVKIIRKSIMTWVVKNYLPINLVLVGVWLILIIWYLFKLNK